MEVTVDLTKRIEWLKNRIKLSESDESYIKEQMMDLADEVRNSVVKALNNKTT